MAFISGKPLSLARLPSDLCALIYFLCSIFRFSAALIYPLTAYGVRFSHSFSPIQVLGFGEYIEEVHAAYEQHKLETLVLYHLPIKV